jgi:hypothetical protein
VLVVETTTGYQGVEKAVRVVPLQPPVVAAPPARAAAKALVPWDQFVHQHPRWSDLDDVVLPFARAVPALRLPTHPLFAPWLEAICAAPVRVDLDVPPWNRPDPFEPGGVTDDFAHGSVAFLDEPRWPACGRCALPLELCIQLSATTLHDWAPGRGSLVAMYCFACGVLHREDPRVADVRFVRGEHRVVRSGPPLHQLTAKTQRVVARPARRLPPSASWHRFRSEDTPDTAGASLLGFEPVGVQLPEGCEELDPESLDEAYDSWLEGNLPGGQWGGACLGGAPGWDQADATPRCPTHNGELRQLLEYEGGQFLDGALHVFICTHPGCPTVRFVAEF